ncbi:MAG: hypothetical protein ACF8Q5_05750 [Phycisphaerales bacterium JB040]
MEEEREILLAPRPGRLRTIRRRCVFTLAGIVIVTLLGYLVLGRSPVTRMILIPQIESYLSVIASADRVRIGPDGVVTVEGLVLTAPGYARPGEDPPPHARFFEVDRAKVYLDWSGVFAGEPRVRRMEVDGGTIRLSQSTETNQLNVSGLAFLAGGSTDSSLQLPQIIAEGFTFELGEHTGQDYTKLRTIGAAGQLEPPTEDGVNVFRLTQSDSAISWSSGRPDRIPMTELISCSGRIAPDGVKGVVRGVSLDAWRPEDLPGPIRAVLEQLDLDGDIPEVSGELTPSGDFRLYLTLAKVGVTLPFSPENAPGQMARLAATDGTIYVDQDGLRASLSGELQGLNYSVEFDYRGFGPDAAFTATLETDFRLEDDLGVLVFAPDEVIEKLSWFGNPVADVHATISVARGAPAGDAAADPELSGVLRFSNGTAAYKNFAYPFVDMSGLARFDTDQLVIERISGTGPSGASMTATARFAPLGEESQADIRVTAGAVPIDYHLLDALSPGRRDMVRHIFSEDRYLELLDNALVLLPGERETLAQRSRDLREQLAGLTEGDPARGRLLARLDRIDQQLRTPAFDFGGVADVTVDIHRPLGLDTEWTKDIRVSLDNVGVVPRLFPFPMIASGVRLQIDNDAATISGGVFTGLTGGRAELDARIRLTDENGEPIANALPTIAIGAENIPIDPRLLAAIPGYTASDPGEGFRGILERLGPQGFVGATASIRPRRPGELGYDITIPLQHVSGIPAFATGRAAPSEGHPGLGVTITEGVATLTERAITVDVAGDITDRAGVESPFPFAMLTELVFHEQPLSSTVPGPSEDRVGPPRPGPELRVEAAATALPLNLPLEDLAAVVSEPVSETLATLRTQRDPEGYADLTSTFRGHVGGDLSGATTVTRAVDLAADVGDARVSIPSLDGTLTIQTGAEPLLRFRDLSGSIAVNNDPSGNFEIHGVMPQAIAGLDPARFHRATPGAWTAGLTVTLTRARFESELTRLTARSRLSEFALDFFSGLDLRGSFATNIRIDPIREQVPPEVMPGSVVVPPLRVSGVAEPRSLAFNWRGTPVDVPTVSGVIGFDRDSGWIDRLILDPRDWRMELTGQWAAIPGLGFYLDSSLDVDATTVDAGLRALIPAPVADTLEALEFDPGNAVSLRNTDLELEFVGEDAPVFELDADLLLDQASLRTGVKLVEVSGLTRVEASNTSGRPIFNLGLGLDRARAAGLRLVSLTGNVHNRDGAGRIRSDDLLARVHGGRLAISLDSDFTLSMPAYAADIRLTGARAAPVFADLGVAPDSVPDLENVPASELQRALEEAKLAWANSGDRSRGLLDAAVSITGETRNPAALHGRGRLDIAGGAVVELPGLIPVIELSNLQLPSSSRLDEARIEFYMQGRTVHVDEISIASNAIELYGGGTIGVPEVDFDLWLRSRPLRGIPILSDVFGGIRDEIITTTIKGTPANIAISSEQFGETRRAINEFLGNETGPSRARQNLGRGDLELRPLPRPVPRVADPDESGDDGTTQAGGPPTLPIQPTPGRAVANESSNETQP